MRYQEADAMPVTFPYRAEVEKAMQVMYHSLRENDRRRYAKVPEAAIDLRNALLGEDAFVRACGPCACPTVRRACRRSRARLHRPACSTCRGPRGSHRFAQRPAR